MLKILVVDDHTIVRNGLCQLLGEQSDLVIVGAAESGHYALELLNEGLDVDVMLTDLSMPGMDGFELTQRALSRNPGLQVIVLSMHSTLAVTQKALAAGAKACFSKDGDIDHLLTSIRAVMQPAYLSADRSIASI
ncbi:MAG: response regulator transcription factor [Pedobacter sp.]